MEFLHTYVPPTKWYRREYAWHFKIVLWPSWIARRLCNHKAAVESFNAWLGEPVDRETKQILEVEEQLDRKEQQQFSLMCPDCGMFVIRTKDGRGVVLAFHGQR